MKRKEARVLRYTLISVFCLSVSAAALTRWSSLHMIPDADFLEGWNYVGEYQGYYFANETEGTFFKNCALARLGISEWADVQAGFAGGVTLGLKAKILGEMTKPYLSLAVGTQNILTHREDYYFNHDSALWKSEFFAVFGKSIESIRLRLHFGIQTMPGVAEELVGGFFALEKYIGAGSYVSIETMYRDQMLRPSLFASLRFFKQHIQLSIGAVDLMGMFFDENGKFAVSFISPRPSAGNYRPGILVSLSFLGGFGSATKYGGFGSIEEQLSYQRDAIRLMKHDLDSLKRVFVGNNIRIDSLSLNFRRVADSALGVSGVTKLKELTLEKLVTLVSLYKQENFDPEEINTAKMELVDYGDIMVPILKEITLDNKVEQKVHIQAVGILGDMTSIKAADAVLEILAQTQDPDVKIEGLIAIGKMRDKRAAYLLEQLAHDGNDAVAFAAAEVLQKLDIRIGRRDADSLSKAPKFPASLPEKRIADTTIAAAKKAPPGVSSADEEPVDSVRSSPVKQEASTPAPPSPPKAPKKPERPSTSKNKKSADRSAAGATW